MALEDTELGVDLAWGTDLDPLGRHVSGAALVRQDILHRITTPRGRLIDDPDYGIDIVGMLSKPLTAQQRAIMPQQIDAEIRKDERIESLLVELEEPENDVWRVSISGESAEGPFELVADVSRAGELVVPDA